MKGRRIEFEADLKENMELQRLRLSNNIKDRYQYQLKILEKEPQDSFQPINSKNVFNVSDHQSKNYEFDQKIFQEVNLVLKDPDSVNAYQISKLPNELFRTSFRMI